MLNYSKLKMINNNIYYNDSKMNEEICNDYVYVIDGYSGKKYRKHRLVWELYNKRRIPKGMVINHIDGNKLNNNPNNLEITTVKRNTKHWYENINTENILDNFNGKSIFAYDIYTGDETFFDTISSASKKLNISTQMICAVLKNKQKTTGGYIFSYTKIENPIDYIIDNIDYKKIRNYKSKTIIANYPNGDVKIFESMQELKDFFNISISHARRLVNGTRKRKDGITFISF